jgi:hypothetical protein
MNLNNKKITHNTQSLKQGFVINDKKNKEIKTGIEKFQTMTNVTNQSLKDNSYSDIDKKANDSNMALKSKTINEYASLKQTVSDKLGNYYYRKDVSNPYLNKVISFSNGELFYVTNQGIAKYISQDTKNEILGKNGCTSTITMINIQWSSSYLKEGVVIPLSPTLITGSQLKIGQACGVEGNNLYVNKIVTNETTKFEGCYADNLKYPSMTFIDGTPPEVINIKASEISAGIVNGNFSEPVIGNGSYTYLNTSSGVPGWSEFYAVIVNSSGAWGYPMPYPKGPQCVSIQCYPPWNQVHSISQTVNFEVGDYKLRFYTCGRNCCDGSGESNPVNIFLGDDLIYLNQPKFSWIEITVPFKITTLGKKKLTFVCAGKTYMDRSTAIQGVTINKVISASTLQIQDGVYNNDFCKQTAIDGGYQYYALQNVNPTTQKGYCAVSNNYVGATMNGFAKKAGAAFSLWESKTDIPGSIGSLNDRGSLSVINPSGAAIFNTSTTNSQYIGCYNDAVLPTFTKISNPPAYGAAYTGPVVYSTPGRAFTYEFGNRCDYNGCIVATFTPDQCKDVATQKGAKYYSLTQSNGDGGLAGCGLSNGPLSELTKLGTATCNKNKTGGVYVNAIYSTGIGSFILTVEDNGNVTIHTGTNPYDKQELLWESKTGGKAQIANSLFTATAGKYGKNWIVGGSTLAAGEFVGSPTGTTYLIMQSDGNLCLYTSLPGKTCITLKDGTQGGDVGNNALYALDEVGNKSKVTNIMYVDENSSLYSYPSQDVNLTTEFTKMTDYAVNGNDLSGTNGSCINSSVENCKTKCNSNKDCYGFTYYAKDNNGWFKGKGMNPVASNPDMKYETYVKNRGVYKEGFVGYNRPVTNISSVKLKTYDNSNYDINYKNINSLSGKTLHEDDAAVLDTENRINHLTDTINDVNVSLKNKINNLNNQSSINSSTIPVYSKKYYDIINNESIELSKSINNINGIVEDSKIVVIQKSSMFVFWCILTILMSIILIRILSMR